MNTFFPKSVARIVFPYREIRVAMPLHPRTETKALALRDELIPDDGYESWAEEWLTQRREVESLKSKV